jgi:carboxylesterase type B
MVWIAGGMFEFHGTGASPWYGGSAFARDGVVCVTINYRVGAEGFLFLGEENANRGLLDQIAALEWVRDNIAVFGGDPATVTVFGESAGALSIGALLSSPHASGLFRRAILQSGAAHHACSAATARRLAHCFGEKLGVEPIIGELAKIPVSCILEAQAELRAELETNPDPELWGADISRSLLPWQPVIDGELLTALPIDVIKAGAGGAVDILVGTNRDENRLFLASGGMIDRITNDALAAAVAGYGVPVDSTLNAYRNQYPHASPGDLLAAIQTDWYWRVPAIRLADAHIPMAGRTYMYELAWPSPAFDDKLGACHSLEIPFVFDTLGNSTELLWGSEPPQALAQKMHAAWVAFATSGVPGWPKYDFDRRATMRFDSTSEVVYDPRSEERTIWEGLR